MKKAVWLLPLLAVALTSSTAVARADAPYNTWAWGPGFMLVMTQPAYTPVDEIDLDVAGPEDMLVAADGQVYVADTGNSRIVKLKDFQVVATYGEGLLKGPTGLDVGPDGTMYIADGGQEAIVILDADGQLIRQFGRPSEPLFGRNREFLPRKIAVDVRQNLFIISEGSVDGVVQMNTDGQFIGYFGANTAAMSLKMILQRMFLTQEQLDQFVKNEAASPSNLDIDGQSLLYTVTAGTDRYHSIRRYTVAGRNIYPETFGSSTFRDIHASADGLVLAVDAQGQVYEQYSNGWLLFLFGAPDTGDQRLGSLTNPTAIDRNGDFVYVLDKDKNAIVVFRATAFAQQVHTGIALLAGGFYEQARPYFEQVLNANGSFIIAYYAIAQAYFKTGDYARALTYYRYAEDPYGYSEAFWELRNRVLQQYLGPAIVGLVGLWLALLVAGHFNRRYQWTAPLRQRLAAWQRIRLVDDLVFLFRFIRHPADSFYYIKTGERGSLLFAGLIYTWVVAVRVLTLYFTGFALAEYLSPVYIRLENEILLVLGLIVIWNAANYLISTISDGEGRVRDVVIGTAYSLFPYALFALPIALASNVLTQNEIFMYEFSQDLVWAWTGLMLVIMVQEIHNYSFSETVRNVLQTLFTMALIVLTGYILYVLFNQLFDFVTAILREVWLRG